MRLWGKVVLKNEYLELREGIKGLGRLKGERSTEEIIERFDSVWRLLLRTRVKMLNTLKKSGRDISGIQNDDFLSIYLQIHNPKSDTRMCTGCFSSVDHTFSDCPFCGNAFADTNSDDDMVGAIIDFDQPEHRPDWDIDYSNDEMLDKARRKEEANRTPVIKPITKLDEIPGPTGTPFGRPNKKPEQLARSTQSLISWRQREELVKGLPYSPTQLHSMSVNRLRQVADLFPSVDFMKDLNHLTKHELCEKILGIQHNEKPDIGPMPYGELPEVQQ